MSCPKKDKCPLFPQFQLESMLEIWKIRYCEHKSRFDTCERYMRSNRGDRPPPNLLPDGSLLPTAD